MQNLYRDFDKSRLYTLSQALGNAVVKLHSDIKIKANGYAETVRYIEGCIEDCEAELKLINDVFVEIGEASK